MYPLPHTFCFVFLVDVAPVNVAGMECENGSYQCRLGSSVRVTPISVARVECGGESAPSLSMRPWNAGVGGTNQMNHWDAAVLSHTKPEPCHFVIPEVLMAIVGLKKTDPI